MDILNFVSKPPKTIFAPQWNYVIFEADISSFINLQELKQIILRKEKEVINNYSFSSDWGTGLGENSMTSRSDSYNLLSWPESAGLANAIKYMHDQFVSGLGVQPEKNLYIQCWANVMRKNEKIAQHQHWNSPYTYLGGHVCIQQSNTNTNYVNPYTKEAYSSKNASGKLTLFPNWVEHYTDVHLGDEERITVAFDIITQVVFDEDIFPDKKSHWIKLS
jgi:hypothetical protein